MIIERFIDYFRKDVVLAVSFVLAVISCIITPPNAGYADYIDFNTLIMLFCLMLIVEGLRRQNVFLYVGSRLLKQVRSPQGVALVLVFLCFFASMFITNDVSLITFVPFGLLIMEMTGMTKKAGLIVVLMTIAANLGSMFTPIGNPQNIYLFSLSGMAIGDFLLLMLPYTAVSAALLLLCIFIGCRGGAVHAEEMKKESVDPKQIWPYIVLFILCLVTVSGLFNHWLLLVVVAVGIFWKDRRLFGRIDYSLLLTFVFFFVFTGNINGMPQLREWLISMISGRETQISIAASQVISNVPAAMLLSAYTDDIPALIVGTNLGGLGTLIASMASLISYKQMAVRFPQTKKRYILLFTVLNVVFLAVLWLFYAVLRP